MGAAQSGLSPAVLQSWELKDEAIRVFNLADEDGDGFLNEAEVKYEARMQPHDICTRHIPRGASRLVHSLPHSG